MALSPERRAALMYHPATPERALVHERLRQAAIEFATVLEEQCPPSRESSLAQTAVQESLMWANAAVAIHQGPSAS